MFWSSKKPSREEEKEKQIKGLQHAFPSIRRPNNDDELFEVRFVVEGQYSSLRILCTGEFPNTAPVIQAQGPVNHSWLNAQKVVVGSPKLKNWSKTSHLSEVVEECVQALMSGTNAPLSKPPVDSYGRPINPTTATTTATVSSGGGAPQPTQQPAPAPIHTAPTPAPYQQPQQVPTPAPVPTPLYNNPFAPPPLATAMPTNQRLSTAYQPAVTPSISPQPQQATPYTYNAYPGVASPSYHTAASPPVAAPASAAIATAHQPPQPQYGQYAAYPSVSPSVAPAIPGGYGAVASPYSMATYGANPVNSHPTPANNGYATTPAPIPSCTLGVSGGYAALPIPGVAAIPAPSVNATASTANRLSPTPPPIILDTSSKSNVSVNSSKKATVKDEPISPIPIPDIPTSFPELEKLTDIQLERLLHDDVSLTAQAKKVDSITTVLTLRDQLHQANHERATNNVKMSEEMMALQRQAAELQAKLRNSTNEYRAMSEEATRKYGQNMGEIVAELNRKKDGLDNQSEELGRKLVQGDMELAAFMKEYLESRTKYHNLQDRLTLATRAPIH